MREWLVFFSDGQRFAWWDIWTRPGFRHVLAAGFDAAAGVWVIYDPRAAGTRLEVLPPGPELDGRLGGLVQAAPRVLRMRPRGARTLAPPVFGCVGAIKALLGVRGALSPPGLYRQLLRLGAEVAWWPPPPAPPEDTQ